MRLNSEELRWIRHQNDQRFKPGNIDTANLLDTIDELTRERNEARASLEAISSTAAGADSMVTELKDQLALAEAAIAAAIREAAARRCQFCREGKPRDDKYGHIGGYLCTAKDLLRITPATAIHAEKLLVAQARQRESQKWHDKMKSHSPMCTQKEAESSWECQFLLDATAALEAIQKEKPDGK